jgi:hypothetical protein
MKRPKNVKIGAHRYSVQYGPTIVDMGSQAFLNGESDHYHNQIRINGERPHTLVAETFVHEALHAIDNERRLDLTEHQVDQLAAGFLAMMIDNPDVFGKRFLGRFK